MCRRLVALSLAVLIAGFAFSQALVPPVETDFASDTCQFCRMKVTDPSYTAEIVTSKGALFFDDYGCLVQYLRAGTIAATEVKAAYVRSAAGDSWLPVSGAVWVLDKTLRTPMGYGLHAFPDRKAADAFIAGHAEARPVAYEDLDRQIPAAMKRKM